MGDAVVSVDSRYYRPTEVDLLIGDPTKAKNVLGWEPTITAQEMCVEMVACDLLAAKRDILLKNNGHSVTTSIE